MLPKKKQSSTPLELADILGDPDEENDGNDNGSVTRKKYTDPERRERLPDFWYRLINDGGCIRQCFLDYFDEEDQYQDDTPKERSCSNCNPGYSLDDLDSSKYYLYCLGY